MLIPAALVVALALVPAPTVTGTACTTDGPQFACYLERTR